MVHSDTGIYLLDGYRLYAEEELVTDRKFYRDERAQLLSAREIAAMYKPILYKQTGDYDPSPEALYYRIVTKKDAMCIQYYGCWAVQFLPLGVSLQHVYDYEPIFIYLKKIGELPFQVVFSGGDMISGFHWVEVHTKDDYVDTSKPFQSVKANIAPRCIYPFSLRGKRETVEDLRVFHISDKLLPSSSNPGKFDGTRLKLAIGEAHHVYNVDILKRKPFRDVPLRELTDEVLTSWYGRYFERKAVEPFQHDVSDPMTGPFIRYKKEVMFSKIKVEASIAEENDGLQKLRFRVFEAVDRPITRLSATNFRLRIDDKPIESSIEETDEMGNYYCTIDLSKIASGKHRLFIQIIDYLGNISETIKLNMVK